MSLPASLGYAPEPRTELRTFEPQFPATTAVEDKVFISKVVTVTGWHPRYTQSESIPVKQSTGRFERESTWLLTWYGRVKELHGKLVAERDLQPIKEGTK